MSEFWLGVMQSAIGSGLGFALGIAAFHYQQKRQSTNDAKNRWLASLDALNRLANTAGANVEALTQSKLQFAEGLKPEVIKMRSAATAALDAPIEVRVKHIQEIVNLSKSMHYFYLSLPKISIMIPPDFSEYSALSRDMPALTLFVHRAMSMTHDVNDQLLSRNDLIAEQAREGGSGEGLGDLRVHYYSSMLSDSGDAICEYIDFSLDFWRLVLDQLNAYRAKTGVGDILLKYELIPAVADAMPKDELFPLMREKLTKFS